MHQHNLHRWLVALLAMVSLVACRGADATCDPDANTGCNDGRVCERVRGGTVGCFAPVSIEGRVFTLTTNAAIANARVIALDDNSAPASGVATTDANGQYTLRVPSERNMDGTPVGGTYTLRADAANHQSFPGGLRPALPIDTRNMGTPDGGVVVRNATTEIGLIPLAAGTRGTIEGTVTGERRAGVLVVGGGSSAISDRDGSFVLFNVTPGAVTVRGYAQGVQLTPAMATVTADMRTTGVTLNPSTTPLATVSGSLQLVNAGGVSATSVMLAVRERYNAVLDRGEVPRGLRLRNISGAFSFTDVPDGEYVVLAASDNDGAVRDPDPGIGGTDLVYVTVPAAGDSRTIQLAQSFKVTGALATLGPGVNEPEMITGTPTLRWADDSSEDGYEVRVFNALGEVVWENLDLPSVSGGGMVSVMYGGPALQAGMYYQFRATSWRAGRGGVARAPISRTEELRGVFFLPSR